MRVLVPRVHVEVFRPTQVPDTTEAGNETTVRINPKYQPTELLYVRTAIIEDRRIKGIQFEETALFGGFIEINIAEDPQSELFDKFLPNDHVEVFYSDTVKRSGTDEENFMHNLNVQADYDFTSDVPKFQGASWKSDLKYRPTMVTTQLHAWDYLRIMQYVNIPRGVRKNKTLSTRIKINQDNPQEVRLKATQQREKFGDDMLDFIDGAIDSFVDNNETISIYGQNHLGVEHQSERGIVSGLKFSATNAKTRARPIMTLYNAGIGEHCHEKIRNHETYSKFNEIVINKFGVPTPVLPNQNETRRRSTTWSESGFDRLTSPEEIISSVTRAIDEMERYDILQFRFLDGDFSRYGGLDQNDEPMYDPLGNYVCDIIAISQFALIELFVKKLTSDHGLNQWFTPIVRIDPEFLQDTEDLGEKVGKKISKLIYVRFREVHKNGKESTLFAFNIDTYPFAAKFSTDAFRLAVGNISRIHDEDPSKSDVDKFAELFLAVDFPQHKLIDVFVPTPQRAPDTYSLWSLTDEVSNRLSISASRIISQKELYDDLQQRFIRNFSTDQEFESESNTGPTFYREMMKRVSGYAALIQKVLGKDDKLISYIRGVPASFMRADIYTGSKFNTIQYDSLAITRIIQLIVSSMAGFPSTNAPKSNTEKGSIDSYPIFAANRIVIKPRTYFGILDKTQGRAANARAFHYDLYPSLSELFKNKGYGKEGEATCFLFLDVAKKKLKDAGEDNPPDFIFPMEDIQDFGMIKASTVNHYFNFSIANDWKDFNLISDIDEPEIKDENNLLYKNVTENGIFIKYREAGLLTVGFSPPEHQHLNLDDLTQSGEYKSWAQRYTPNTNIDSSDTSKPVFHPEIAYINNQNSDGLKIYPNNYLINNYDNFSSFKVMWLTLLWHANSVGLPDDLVNDELTTYLPYHGISAYCDISDIKAEFKALEIIMTNPDTTYRDISNVDLELMEQLVIKAPLKFTYNKNAEKYSKRIIFHPPTSGGAQPKVFGEQSLKTTILNINEQLDKIGEIEMMWLFPYSGYVINKLGDIIHVTLEEQSRIDDTWRKHLFLLTYLDLLIKGIRYILWSMAKARFFAHVYIPMEYQKYAQKTPDGGINKSSDVVEPGSSVQIRYNDDNTLFKTIEDPLVAFPIIGLERGDNAFLPLYRTVTRGTTSASTEEQTIGRDMTWYVSKKVTYIGADVGAMVRVEMTEGSLDWTLFYNEKNLLTQVSEHYLLNGLGNFRSGATF